MIDYYRVLGISPQADDREIKKAYRKMAKQYHPDSHPNDPESAKRFKACNDAYMILGNPERRKAYDEERSADQVRTGGKGRKNENNGGRDGQGTSPSPDMGAFERFFGFQPGKGMETYQDRRKGAENVGGPLKPEEMFAAFFGKMNGEKAGKTDGKKTKG